MEALAAYAQGHKTTVLALAQGGSLNPRGMFVLDVHHSVASYPRLTGEVELLASVSFSLGD